MFHVYSVIFDIYKISLYKYNLTSTTIHSTSFQVQIICGMSHLYSVNEQVDNELNDENCFIPEESRRNLRLQSFVDRYGNEELEISSTDRTKQYVRKKCSSLNFECCINAFLNKIPIIRCLKEYNIRKNLFEDIISGITVAIMHIPQGKKEYRL